MVKGNLRIASDSGQSNFHPLWFFDPNDPEENAIGARVQRVSFITDANGNVLPGGETRPTKRWARIVPLRFATSSR